MWLIKNVRLYFKSVHKFSNRQRQKPVYKDPCRFCFGLGSLKHDSDGGKHTYIKKCVFCDGSGESYLTY